MTTLNPKTQTPTTGHTHLTVLAIFKNESHIMREWLEHYSAEGADSFYLIDNGSDPEHAAKTDEAIAQYGATVTLVRDATPHAQVRLYNEAARSLTEGFKVLGVTTNSGWLLVVDLDEFMYASDSQTLAVYLRSRPPHVGAVAARWLTFGSSGLLRQPDRVVDGFLRRAAYPLDTLREVKTAVRLEALQALAVHEHRLRPGFVTEAWLYDSEKEIAEAPLRLNHYVLQSRSWFDAVKATRGDVAGARYDAFRDAAYFERYDALAGDVEDGSLRDKRRDQRDQRDPKV
jgi:hypothetical protein